MRGRNLKLQSGPGSRLGAHCPLVVRMDRAEALGQWRVALLAQAQNRGGEGNALVPLLAGERLTESQAEAVEIFHQYRQEIGAGSWWGLTLNPISSEVAG